MTLFNTTELSSLLGKFADESSAKPRGKRAISAIDKQAILDLHNKLRGQVYPSASNMEYMVWDTELERSAEEWAETCLWEHGPEGIALLHLMFRHGTTKLKIILFHILKSVILIVHSDAQGRCVLTTHRGNWWGSAPYKPGTPCSACPPSYGGGCKDNLCYKDDNQYYYEETEEDNVIEPEAPITTRRPDTHLHTHENTVVSTEQMSGCLYNPAKVFGTVYYEMHSSICRAGLHYGVIDNNGGWLDVTRKGRQEFFIKSYKNGIQSLGIYCPHNCLQERPHVSRVIGTKIYSDKSSICRSAIHAGVMKNEQGGYIDVMPVENRLYYYGSNQNNVQSESMQNPPGAKAFRVFAVI
ncbi:Cysteine-rich secretory protein LCCL domain-containing 2 [Bagarius yarrelli]|uniref:Cysteine-rich secretory protein LCCL domain-containing 2 n=1 Tax=Bagarius yarrelli TaxID=175774 RepID=A0A556TWD7_BAGYA|nr:Cysteine-rich secretory protein LCCL domain-containing 2 [Bagarius yarrelli]